MKSNEETELTRKMGPDSGMESRRTAGGVGRLGGGEGLSKKEKELMDMDSSVMIAGGRGCKGTKW